MRNNNNAVHLGLYHIPIVKKTGYKETKLSTIRVL